jgi:hypothetical protein
MRGPQEAIVGANLGADVIAPCRKAATRRDDPASLSFLIALSLQKRSAAVSRAPDSRIIETTMTNERPHMVVGVDFGMTCKLRVEVCQRW